MVDIYIDKKKAGYVVLAKKRNNIIKRSCYDEIVFSFFRKERRLVDLLSHTYKGIIQYIDEGLLLKGEDIHIRSLDKELFDAFSKSRKSLGKMKTYLDDFSYSSWKEIFNEKNILIKKLMLNKSRINIINDTLEDKITESVIKEIKILNIDSISSFANIKKQKKINNKVKEDLKKYLLAPPLTITEKDSLLSKNIKSVHIYSDGGISIKGYVETGHSYGGVMIGLDNTHAENELVIIKGKIEILNYMKEKHNVDFMELYSAYRLLSILKEKIELNEIDKHVLVVVKTDNQSNVDVFNGVRGSKHIGNNILWEQIASFSSLMRIRFEWVKGHDKSKYNNVADMLVQEGRQLLEEIEVRVLDSQINKIVMNI